MYDYVIITVRYCHVDMHAFTYVVVVLFFLFIIDSVYCIIVLALSDRKVHILSRSEDKRILILGYVSRTIKYVRWFVLYPAACSLFNVNDKHYLGGG